MLFMQLYIDKVFFCKETNESFNKYKSLPSVSEFQVYFREKNIQEKNFNSLSSEENLQYICGGDGNASVKDWTLTETKAQNKSQGAKNVQLPK